MVETWNSLLCPAVRVPLYAELPSTVALSDEALRLLRGWTDAGRIAFQDGTGRTAVMPFSPRGLPQALDALAKEDAS